MKNKKCDFDNDIFISLLEGFQNKKEYSLEEGSEAEDENIHRFRNVNIDSLDSFLWSTGSTREPYSTAYVTGWPSENGGKKIIHPGYSFGITKNTEHKDSAWEFIKFILNSGESDLNEDFGDGFSMEGISKSVSEKKIDEFLNETASLNEYSCSEDDLKAYRECLEMPACSDMIYQGVIGIISEEIVHIYEDRTAEEVAKSIQNKVTLYLNEIS